LPKITTLIAIFVNLPVRPICRLVVSFHGFTGLLDKKK